jgi:hypothetical protein
MRRRTFDILMSTGGLVVTILLVVAGSLAFVGYSFANNNVHKQLAEQKIFFPPKGPATADARIGPFINKYAGKQLVTGAQAEAYANHFIAVHISDIGKGTYYEGKTYAELGAVAKANPNDKTIGPARDTVFKGETLRGLLLQAYAFWKIGQLALIGAIVAWAMAGVFALLTLLGFAHVRKVSPEVELLAPHFKATQAVPA